MGAYSIIADNGASVTPSDGGNFLPSTLYVGTGGDIKVKTESGAILTFVGIQSGTFMPVVVTRVYLTGTTASDIIRLTRDA